MGKIGGVNFENIEKSMLNNEIVKNSGINVKIISQGF
jgi:hypothetical protein